MNRWSPHPRDCYAVEKDGFMVGLGGNMMFDHIGVWNIFWLSSHLVDDALFWKGDPGSIPSWTSTLPIIVGTAEQYVGEDLLKEYAATSSPREFVQLVRNASNVYDLIAVRMLTLKAWVDDMESRIEKHFAPKVEVILPASATDKVVPFNKNVKGA